MTSAVMSGILEEAVLEPSARDEQPYTIDEAAAMFRVHPNTLRRWCREGSVRSVKVGPRVLVPRAEVRRRLTPKERK